MSVNNAQQQLQQVTPPIPQVQNNQQMQQQQPQQMQQQQQQQQPQQVPYQELSQQERLAMLPPRAEGFRPAVIRESRIKDRPYKEMNDSLSIKIELDLEVEVDLYARVKGDVMIGLL